MIANVLLDNTKKFNKKFSQYLQQKETMDYVMKNALMILYQSTICLNYYIAKVTLMRNAETIEYD